MECLSTLVHLHMVTSIFGIYCIPDVESNRKAIVCRKY